MPSSFTLDRMPARRTLVALAVIAAVVTAAVFVTNNNTSSPRDRLAVAIEKDGHRTTTLQLSGLPYTRPPDVRSARKTHTARAAYRVLTNSFDDVHLVAVATLLTGAVDQAVPSLFRLVEQDPKNAALWNDYAVALYEQSDRGANTESAVLALVAIDRALRIDPAFAIAQFNRATILDRLSLRRAARQAWLGYLRIDEDSERADDVRQILVQPRASGQSTWNTTRQRYEAAALEQDAVKVDAILRTFAEEARTWAEGPYLAEWGEATLNNDRAAAQRALSIARFTGARLSATTGECLLRDAVRAIDAASDVRALASAHTTYRTARLAVRDRKVSEAEKLLGTAERQFNRAGSPMAFVARHYRASAIFDQHRADEALSVFATIASETPREYLAVRAQTISEQARVLGRGGKRYESLQLYRHAADLFRRLGEATAAAQCDVEAASKLTALRQLREAWQLRQHAFRVADARGAARLAETALHVAARDEIAAGRIDVGHTLLRVSNPEEKTLSPLVRFDILLWRALIAARESGAGASQAIAELSAAAARLPDPALRATAEDQLRFAQAFVVPPQKAITLLDESIRFREATGIAARTAEAYVARGRAQEHAGRPALAERDYLTAIERIERQRTDILQADLRDSFFDAAESACARSVTLQVKREAFSDAFATIERCRGRALLDAAAGSSVSARPLTLVEAQRVTDADAVIAQYTTLENETLLVILTGKQSIARRLPHSRAALAGHATRLVGAIVRNDSHQTHTAARALYDALIAPLEPHLSTAKKLIVAGDEILGVIPFAALEDRKGQPVFMKVDLMMAPSVSAHARNPPERTQKPRALVVGDPAFSHDLTSHLPRLPRAAAEAESIARLYDAPVLLLRDAATLPRVREALEHADIVHIATHAMIHRDEPSSSILVLAPSAAESGLLYLSTIAKMQLRRRPIVVLAGCRTGATREGPGAIHTLAAAFLAAGARSVVATQWDVEDGSAATFSRIFHEKLRTAPGPSTALRQTQSEMRNSTNTRFSRPSAWAAFVVYGSG